MPPEEQCEDSSSPARYWRPSSSRRSAWPRRHPLPRRHRHASERATAALQYLLAPRGADGSNRRLDRRDAADFRDRRVRSRLRPQPLHGCSAGGRCARLPRDGPPQSHDAQQDRQGDPPIVAAGDNPAARRPDLTARLDLFTTRVPAPTGRLDVQPVFRGAGGGRFGRHGCRAPGAMTELWLSSRCPGLGHGAIARFPDSPGQGRGRQQHTTAIALMALAPRRGVHSTRHCGPGLPEDAAGRRRPAFVYSIRVGVRRRLRSHSELALSSCRRSWQPGEDPTDDGMV